MRYGRSLRLLIIATAYLLNAACDQQSSGPTLSPSSTPNLNIQDVATSASTADAAGTLRDGVAPSAGRGPTVTVTGNQTIINGGTLSVTVEGSAPFTTVYVVIGAKILGLAAEAAGGINGYYAISLPSPRTSASVLLAFPQTIPLNDFELLFAAADASGAVGNYARLTTNVIEVGTGDVQVTLSWDTDSDTDLHVIDPSGEEIFYAHRRSASGGELDLDSNAACALDHKRNENITWPVGRGPAGHYIVRVDYWDACGVSRTNYTVRVISGGSGQVVSGSFTGSGDQGGGGSGTTVATFDRQSGPTLSVGSVPATRPTYGVSKGINGR